MRARTAQKTTLCSVMLAGLIAASAQAAMFPANPTTNDDNYAVLKYPCPYPDPANPPKLIRDNNKLLLEVTTEGTVCFDNALIPKDHAFNLGKLQPGDYTITVQHRYRLGNGTPSETYWTNAAVRDFKVLQGMSNRISGLWTSESRTKDGFNITLLDPQNAFVVWNTNGPNGKPIWLYGNLQVQGNSLVGKMSFNRNLSFGDFKVDQSETTESWGTLQLDLRFCGSINASWVSEQPGFSSGSALLGQLSTPRGLEGCLPEAAIPYGTQPVGQ
jgi:hypothetical protein